MRTIREMLFGQRGKWGENKEYREFLKREREKRAWNDLNSEDRNTRQYGYLKYRKSFLQKKARVGRAVSFTLVGIGTALLGRNVLSKDVDVSMGSMLSGMFSMFGGGLVAAGYDDVERKLKKTRQEIKAGKAL